MKKITQLNKIVLSMTMVLSSLIGFSQSQTFTTTGTFTVPAGVYQITVEAWGGGGRGGTCVSQNGMNVGGGGGGGAYAAKAIAVTPGTIYVVNIGNGSGSSANGSDTWFNNNTTILAKGGYSCGDNFKTGALGGQASMCIGDISASGGKGADGIDNIQGGGGGASSEAGDAGEAASAFSFLGALSTCGGGNGGNAYTATNGDGNPGTVPGGGGGGGKRNNNNGVNIGWGGIGANGKVVVRWTIITVPVTVLTSGPGGVTNNLQLWLRSDLLNGTNSYPDNTAVSTWNTLARGADAVKPLGAKAPMYRNSASYNINFNSVVDFTNNPGSPSQTFNQSDNTREYLAGASGFNTHEIFVVVVPDVTVNYQTGSMDVFCGDRLPCPELDKTGVGFGDFSTRFNTEILSYCFANDAKYGAAKVDGASTISAPGIINTRNKSDNSGEQLYFNASVVSNTEVNVASHRNVLDSRYWIGRSEGYDGSLDGRVAEVITFNSRKNDTSERNRIESYLAIKYGITLGIAGTSQDYVSSDGTKIWNASANAGYNFNIAGIGRDDISRLYQKQSKSVNTSPIITIGLGDIALTNTANAYTLSSDKQYLVWGDNGGNMNTGSDLQIVFGGPTITHTDIVNKQWKIVETGGDVGNVKVSFNTTDLSGLPALAGNDAYVMVIAKDAAFSVGVETIFLTTVGLKQEITYDFDGTSYMTIGVAHETVLPRHVTFNGTNDKILVGNTNNLSAAFTIMAWVNPQGQNAGGTDRTILAKYDGTNGYKLVLLADNRVKIDWTGGTSAVSVTALPEKMWHNIAILYGFGSIKIYIDGVLDSTTLSAVPAVNTSMFTIGAEYRSKNDVRNVFNGNIDEVRMWSVQLNLTAVRFIMNQEILKSGTFTKGSIIPATITKNDVANTAWTGLYAYYSMNSYIGACINDDSFNSNRGGLTSPDRILVEVQSAPMPYESAADGQWSDASVWLNGSIQDMPYSASIVNGSLITWNIVKTNNNIESIGNKTLLGLFVNANTLMASNNTKVEVSHYLKLDGTIDLEGRSQLVQPINSDMDPTSGGKIEKDQQGTVIRHNYNYWTSPVGTINTTTNNNSYTVAGMMKDGTNPASPQNIQWTTGVNSSATSPITLSSYWIFKFQNVTASYANWNAVGQNGSLLAGQGFTLKGSSALSATQNYTFVGKPNSGTITSALAANNLCLVGNPYPSALDSNTFITANLASTTGALYFWEHFATNTSHALVQYQGGYATRNLIGGTPPVSPAGISGLGTSSRVPARYIPVSQGFFVSASAAGGSVSFDNSARLFIKEDNVASNVMFRGASNGAAPTYVDPWTDNSDDQVADDLYKKVRLGFNSHNNYHRQVLLGFMDDLATSGVDAGYDAPHIDVQPNDMYFMINGGPYVIQGDGYFNVSNSYDIGVKTDAEGIVTFVLDETENFNGNQNIYIYDNVTGIYNDIRNGNFEINLPAGTITNRFSLRFSNGLLGVNNFETTNDIKVAFSNENNTINIWNHTGDATLTSVSLFNMLGQSVNTWSVKDMAQDNIKIPVSNLATGTYIVQAQTTKGAVSKKILVK